MEMTLAPVDHLCGGSSDQPPTYAKYLIEDFAQGLLTASAAPSVSSVLRAWRKISRMLVIGSPQCRAQPPTSSPRSRRPKRRGRRFWSSANTPMHP